MIAPHLLLLLLASAPHHPQPRTPSEHGYLSLWIEVVRDPGRKRSTLPDRLITVISTWQTGGALLDD
ncbi:hypothetical protein MVEN_02564200 [Mycena venus]|uniref:Secreted protein n=1 Tax=Mycena venus TaxID=2733690 RepID=A0A8H6TZB8_9AGAR|nr:hypothetical protein MVEN_02564200 [Mycena venus]